MASDAIKKSFRNLSQRLAQFIMNHQARFKPLFGWVPPETRTRLKSAIMGRVFKALYGESSSEKEGKRKEHPSGEGEKTGVPASPLLKGVHLVGLPNAVIGEGEFVRQTARSFQSTALAIRMIDASPSRKREADPLANAAGSGHPFKVNIFHLKPDQLEASVVALGRSFVENRYNIGYWVWELSEFPDAWQAPLDFLDEVWCPSRFIQSAVMKKSQKPVVHLPLSIEMETSPGFDRASFSLPPNSFIFLFVFDFKSFITRKNPEACIHAFLKAFPRGGEAVNLVIKSMDGSNYPVEYERLAEQAKRDARIILIDQCFRSAEITGLIETCDCFLSLHRSEGIGLSLAQSMLLGKPVIATAYSGNMDFMSQDNSCPVKFDLIEVRDKEYPFSEGQVWADPDLEHAAWFMRRMVHDEDFRQTIASSGQATIREHHNCDVIGKAYVDRLKDLGLA